MDNRQPNRRIVSQSNARTVRPAEKKPPVQLLIRLRGGVDRPFLILVLILVCLGSIMVFSASFAYAGYKYDNPYYFVIRQSVWAVLGFSVMILTMQFDYRIYQKLTVPFFIISTILLCLVPFIGSVRNGAKRWIIIGPISVQPSEIMKLALVMLLALYISSNRDRMHTFRYGIMIPYVMIGGVMLITVIERHISATLILFLIGTIVIFIGGAPTKILGGFAAIGATIMGGVVLFSSYAKERVEFWLHPEEDPSDSGYQLLQSLYAIGSGTADRNICICPNPKMILFLQLSAKNSVWSAQSRSFACLSRWSGAALSLPCVRRIPIPRCWYSALSPRSRCNAL